MQKQNQHKKQRQLKKQQLNLLKKHQQKRNQQQKQLHQQRQQHAYIKQHDLQDPANRRMINADDKLKAVFGGKAQVSMFEMTKLISGHLK
ncbi:MAG: hypothetical protein HYZ45_06170 [Burkholderiales bacterium]|nr:hypothetical protein [Burkholderiales bacterium]